MEQREQLAFVAAQASMRRRLAAYAGAFRRRQEILDDHGMNVALAADRGRVAELLGHLADRRDELTLGGQLGRNPPPPGQTRGRQHGARPGTEIFGREIPFGDGTQVVVDVARFHDVRLPAFVDVLEQLVPRNLLTSAHDGGELAVLELDAVLFARLAPKVEPHPRAADVDVVLAQRGEAVRTILARVLVVADADERQVEESNDGGEHLLAWKPGAREVGLDARADRRKRFAERGQAVELRFVARGAPVGVVAILLASLRIAACRLHVASFRGADPDVGPGRRNGEAPNP